MRTTTHKCDRCGITGDPTTLPLEIVGFGVTYEGRGMRMDYSMRKADFCNNCLKALGLVPYNKAPISLPPTLEDLIVEICRREISNGDKDDC